MAPALRVGLIAALLGLVGCGQPSTSPNIVLILADDLGIGDVAAYNPASKVPTPSLDRLAREGIRLTDAHSPAGVCTPTRYGLLTGRYAWRSALRKGVLWGDSPCLLELGRVTLAELIRDQGYRTACIGKWHLGLGDGVQTDYEAPLRPGPLEFGFERFFGIPAALDMPPYVYLRGDRPVRPASVFFDGSPPARIGGGGFWRPGPGDPEFVHSEVLPRTTDEAVDFLERRAEAGEPFFLYFPLSAPHTPWVPTDAFRGVSGAGVYGDFAAQVDHTVGRVLDALDRLDLSDDTLVIFTSDNGAHWTEEDKARYGHEANHPYRGQKGDIWEGGHRVPFLARWPGRIPAGAVRDDTICLTDLVATLAALVGAALPDDAAEDSFDFLPSLVEGRIATTPPREAMVLHSHHGMFAVREGPWKLIFGRGSGGFSDPVFIAPTDGEPPGQLYHLGDDIGETTNLYLDRPDVVARLTEIFERYRAEGRSRPPQP